MKTIGRPGLPGLCTLGRMWKRSGVTSGCIRYCFVFTSMRSSVYILFTYTVTRFCMSTVMSSFKRR